MMKIDLKQIEALAREAIGDHPELFIAGVYVSANNAIRVFADGDQGIDLAQCVGISRHIERNLDREAVDFSLEVSSPGGMENPLQNPRSLNKFKGKNLRIRTEKTTFEGEVTAVDPSGLTLQWQARMPKPVGKGKVTVVQSETFDLKTLQSATLTPLRS